VCFRPVATDAISLARFIALDRACQALVKPTDGGNQNVARELAIARGIKLR